MKKCSLQCPVTRGPLQFMCFSLLWILPIFFRCDVISWFLPRVRILLTYCTPHKQMFANKTADDPQWYTIIFLGVCALRGRSLGSRLINTGALTVLDCIWVRRWFNDEAGSSARLEQHCNDILTAHNPSNPVNTCLKHKNAVSKGLSPAFPATLKWHSR